MTQGNKHNPIGEESRLFGCRALLLHDWVKTQEVQNRSKGTLEHKCSMIWNPNSEHPSHWTCTCKYPGRLSTQTSFAKLQHKPSGGAFHTPNLNNHKKKKKLKIFGYFFPSIASLDTGLLLVLWFADVRLATDPMMPEQDSNIFG